MKTSISLSILFLLLFHSNVPAISKVYSGKPIPTNKTVNGMQFVKKGDTYIDSEEAPFVVIVDKEENSIKITCPSYGHPDSLYCELVLGDLITISFAADVTWDSLQNSYTYNYTVTSEHKSRTPIDHIRIDQLYEYKDVKSASAWIGYFNRNYKTQSWTQHKKTDLLMPGKSVSGFGYVSENPPVLGNFLVSGETKQKSTAEDDLFFPPLAELLDEHDGIKGITIIPGPKPEKIHGPPWIMQILSGLGKLASHGYTRDSFMDVRRILLTLYENMRDLKKPSFDTWNQLINNALNQLAPYESKIEPEAWSYITENLKYMQRNKDIIWFGK